VALKSKRRNVTNEEFQIALQGKPGDPASKKRATDNQKIINSVTHQYVNQIDPETLKSCGLHALWRAIGYFNPEYKQKFTSSLYRFTQFECRRELLRRKREGKATRLDGIDERHIVNRLDRVDHEDLTHIRECLKSLNEEGQRLVDQHFTQGMNLTEIAEANCYSKDTAGVKLHAAIETLKQICRSSLGEPV